MNLPELFMSLAPAVQFALIVVGFVMTLFIACNRTVGDNLIMFFRNLRYILCEEQERRNFKPPHKGSEVQHTVHVFVMSSSKEANISTHEESCFLFVITQYKDVPRLWVSKGSESVRARIESEATS